MKQERAKISFKISGVSDSLFYMRIVQVVPELNQGGVERGSVELNRELAKRGHQSAVISSGGTLASQINQDGGKHIQLDVCSKNPFTFLPRARALQTALSAFQPDILHARSRLPAWLCRQANKKHGIPFVTTVHGFNRVGRYSEIMVKGDCVIYSSSAIKDHILKNYAIDEAKLHYVPRGIDIDYFDPKKTDWGFASEFRKKHQLEHRRIVTIVGRITGGKGLDCFVRALAKVQKKHPEAIGVVVGGVQRGKEDYLQKLKTMALKNSAEIRFTGSQSRIREIHAVSDLAVSSAAQKPETFGRAMAEALAMNTPVVASAHGGALDLLIDGENGFFFEPGNSTQLSDKVFEAFQFRFSNMREHIVRRFSLKQMVETEVAIYEKLSEDIGGHGQKHRLD